MSSQDNLLPKNRKRNYLGPIFIILTAAILGELVWQFREQNIENPIALVFIGSLPNFIAGFFCSLLNISLFTPKKVISAGMGALIGLLTYECLQLLVDTTYFDFFDIIFTVSGVLLFFVLAYVFKPHIPKLYL